MYILFLLCFPLLLLGVTSCKEEERSFSADAQFLYWSGAEKGMNFVITKGTDLGFMGSDHGKIIGIDTSWDPGVRAMLGGHLPFDCWDFLVTGTYFKTEQKKTVTLHDEAFLVALWGATTQRSTSQADFARGSWDLHYYILDINLSRDYSVTPGFILTSFLGVKAGWIFQHFDVDYHFSLVHTSFPNLNPFETVRNRFQFQGAGPSVGFNSIWEFANHWNLYGNLGASILYGQMKIDYRSEGGSTTQNNYKNQYPLSRFTYQLGLGILWEAKWRSSLFRFNLGWEQNIWFGLNKLYHDVLQPGGFILEVKNENLSLQGLVAGMRIDY